jgi:hypothetical protein
VRRRWARRPRWRRPDPGKRAELPAGRFPPDEHTAGFALLAFLAYVLTLFVVVLIAVARLVAEAVVLAADAYLLGRSRLVVARTDGPPADERGWPVRGVGASRRAVDEVAELLAAGVDPGRIAERIRSHGEA